MKQLPSDGPRSSHIRLWLDHPAGRIQLRQAGGRFVIAREDLPAVEEAVLVTEVDGVQHPRHVRVPEPAAAGELAEVENFETAVLARAG